MATTAAPTFFNSYNMKERGIFIDGGVNLNNPAMAAYTEALKNKICSQDKTFILSLGTGNFIPEPLNPNQSRGLLFWVNLKNISLLPREGDIDSQLSNLLNQNYQKWQIYFDEPIGFNDCLDSTIQKLLDLANMYIKELYDSDDNEMNRLLEVLEK